jgi:gas vesicle protein
MEIETILALIGAIIGGGGIVGFIVGLLTIKYERHKAKGEAHSAEYEGMKVEQDTYQELILDLKTAWKEQKDYIAELHEDRRNLRIERDELKQEISVLRKNVNEQQCEIDDLKRIVSALKPLMCSQVGCGGRQTDIIGLVSDDSFDQKTK